MVDKKYQCLREGCQKYRSFGEEGTKCGVYCRRHALNGMVNVMSKRCARKGCNKGPSYGVEGSKRTVFCVLHAEAGMVNVVSKRCNWDDCGKFASFGWESNNNRVATYCSPHAKPGMINVFRKQCAHYSCHNYVNYNAKLRKPGTYCSSHAREGMDIFSGKRCTEEGNNAPIRDMQGGRSAAYGSSQAKDSVRNAPRKLRARVRRKPYPEHDSASSGSAIDCANNAEDGDDDIKNTVGVDDRNLERPTCGVKGESVGVLPRKLHATSSMVEQQKKCARHGCLRYAFYGEAGSEIGVYCIVHATSGMTHVCKKQPAHATGGATPGHGVNGTYSATHCSQRAQDSKTNLVTAKLARSMGGGDETPICPNKGSECGIHSASLQWGGVSNGPPLRGRKRCLDVGNDALAARSMVEAGGDEEAAAPSCSSTSHTWNRTQRVKRGKMIATMMPLPFTVHDDCYVRACPRVKVESGLCDDSQCYDAPPVPSPPTGPLERVATATSEHGKRTASYTASYRLGPNHGADRGRSGEYASIPTAAAASRQVRNAGAR